MIQLIFILFLVFLLAELILLLTFASYSLVEKETRAAGGSFLFIIPVIILIVVGYSGNVPLAIQVFWVALSVMIILVVAVPFGNKKISIEIPENRYDEREIMFSRMELQEGSDRFEAYYKAHPDHKEPDDQFRAEAGLLNKKAKFYDEWQFKATEATFATVEQLHPLTEGKVLKNERTPDKEKITRFIGNWAKHLGAVDVGFTLLKEHHLYSHSGRREYYGEKVTLKHKYAIAFTVEMDREMMDRAPRGPVIMESSKQYLKSGQIAVQLAEFIRKLGFDARAHIDGNYKVVCPVVAMDAGLGTIGRMGLLMTPKHGPRVRIAVVTTDLELNTVSAEPDPSVLHFCTICRKCALNCPSAAIPSDRKKGVRFSRWKVNQEKCFTYWTKTGTDCGRCMSVCPYAHPNNPMHNTVRKFIRINPFNRHIALWLDDFFYGKKPSVQEVKAWMKTSYYT